MTRYHPVLVTLHWLLAIMIIVGLIMGGNVLAETPNTDPFKITSLKMHMTMGLIILVLMIVRLIVRVKTKQPAHADIGNALVNKGAVIGHWAFYVIVIAMCASGIGISLGAGLPAIVFGGSGDPLPANFDDLAPRAVHGIIATLLTLTIVVHLGAALYHQFVRKDRLFSRMWYGDRKS